MKKLIALVMTLVLAVSMAAMASAANSQDVHDHDCPDCAFVSVQPRAAGPYCTNSICGHAALKLKNSTDKACVVCGAPAYLYECPDYNCARLFDYCSKGDLVRH